MPDPLDRLVVGDGRRRARRGHQRAGDARLRLTRLMVTLGVALPSCYELANKFGSPAAPTACRAW